MEPRLPTLPGQLLPGAAAVAALFCLSPSHLKGMGGCRVSEPAITGFEVVQGQFGNRLSGVKPSGDGSFYIGAYLTRGAVAALETSVELHVPFTCPGKALKTKALLLEEAAVVRAERYVATDGIQLFGCCGTLSNCPLQTPPTVSLSERAWRDVSFLCPKGTDKVPPSCPPSSLLSRTQDEWMSRSSSPA